MEKIAPSSIREFNNEQDKAFYAAYLNTATQNVYIIIRDISERLGLGFDLSNEANIMNAQMWKHLCINNQPELTNKIIKRLNESFPFINYYPRRNSQHLLPAQYEEILGKLIKTLYYYRNYFSHAIHPQVSIDKTVIWDLEKLYDKARQRLSETNKYTAKDLEHLVRLKQKNQESHSYKTKYRFKNNNNEIQEKGFVFFVSLWLQRKDAQSFLTQHKGFKRSISVSEKATLDCFSYFGIKPPKPRLESQTGKHALLLDMLNDLARCPKHLYPHLSPADRSKFLVNPTQGEEEQILNQEEETVVMRRYDNRFYDFALRYLDDSFQDIRFHIDLGNYCYYPYSKEIEGEVRIRKWTKRMTAFGKLSDFKLSNRPQSWKDNLIKLEDRDRDKTQVYVNDTTPHYHVNNNVIGLRFTNGAKSEWPELPTFDYKNSSSTKPRNLKPHCWLSIYELPALVFTQILFEQGIAQRSAEQLIKTQFEKGKSFLNKVASGSYAQEQLNEALSKANLSHSQIPKSISRYIKDKPAKSFNDKAKERLQTMLDDTLNLLDKIYKQQQFFTAKTTSKDYRLVKCGEMGSFLARDMIFLQKPVNGEKGKANSTEFDILQSKLALFGAHKNTLQQTFKTCNLIDSENPHPFLSTIKIESCVGILSFYIAYLLKRKEYLVQCIASANYKKYHFLKLNPEEFNDTKEQTKKLAIALTNTENNKYFTQQTFEMENTANLPRAMFAKPIMSFLLQHDKTKNFAETLNDKTINASYIIEQYFKTFYKDKVQEFYDYKKSYDIIDKLFDNRKGKSNKLKHLYKSNNELIQLCIKNEEGQNILQQKIPVTVDNRILYDRKLKNKDRPELIKKYKKLYRHYTENEKQIRLSKVYDMVQFMMVQQIYTQHMVQDGKLLKQVNKKTTSTVIDNNLKLGDTKANTNKGILSVPTEVEIKINDKTVITQSKIKNVGNFRAFLKDRRVPQLLEYFPEAHIKFKDIYRELELYNRFRLQYINQLLVFEHAAIKSLALKPNKQGYIEHGVILHHVKNLSQTDTELLKSIRNAFLHNEYPGFTTLQNFVNGINLNKLNSYEADSPESEAYSIAGQMYTLAKQKYNELITT